MTDMADTTQVPGPDATLPEILDLFEYDHLPQPLSDVSSPFSELAYAIVENLPDNDYRAEALKALKVAKDWAVNCMVVANGGRF